MTDATDPAADPAAGDASAAAIEADTPVDQLIAHLTEESVLLCGVLETALDRAVSINESLIDRAHPLMPESPQLADATAIRFQQDETSWACLLPAWLLDQSELPDDVPARLAAALLPETLPFHQPRRAETAELIDADLWQRATRPEAIRLPCDGREDPIWVLAGVPPERQRIGTERLQSVPVTVVVTLAEKRIEVGQLTAISPGALITFAKPCEDLLDLYVNNRAFCRGEAVKIGEKFGLKVTQVGAEPERVSSLLS